MVIVFPTGRYGARLQGSVLAILLLISSTTLAYESGAEPAQAKEPTPLPPTDCVRMIRAAKNAMEAGRHAEAQRTLRAAAAQFPQELAPVLELWTHHRAHPLPQTEATKLRAMLTARLSDPASVIPVGMLEYLVNNTDAGKDELQLVLNSAIGRSEKRPRDRDLLRAIEGLQARLELPDARRDTLARLFELEPTEFLRWRSITLDIDLERWPSVAALVEPLMQRDPVPPRARFVYVWALSKLGRHEALAQQLTQLQSDSQIMRETIEEILLETAWNLRDLGNDEAAERFFRKVMETDPEQQEARAAVLHLYSSEAEREAQQAAVEDTWQQESDPVRLLEQGANLLATGAAEQAFPLLERAAAGLPSSEDAWFNLGICAFQLERWEQAVDALTRSLRINADRAEAYYNRGAALANLKRCEEAITDLEQTLVLRPGLKQTHYYLYVCHGELGNTKAALREYQLYRN